MALTKIKTSNIINDGNLGRRNLLINGDMVVSQRGSTFTGGTGQFYTLDRWIAAVGSAYNFDVTVTQSNTVPTGQGFKHSLKVEANTVQALATTSNAGIAQRLEGQNLYRLNWGTSDAKDVTVSFWVRSNKTGTYCVQLQQNVGSGGSAIYSHVKEYTISVANTWEKKTITFPGNTAQAQTQSTGDGLRVNWWLAGGSDDYTTADTWEQVQAYLITSNQVNFMDSADNEWYLTGCQLEAGDTATPFEHRSFGEELQFCKRYFCKSYSHQDAPGTNTTNGTVYSRLNDSVSNRPVSVSFPVEMRAQPTVTLYSIIGTSGSVSDCDLSYSHVADDTANLGVGGTGATGFGAISSINAGAGEIIGMNWTAESEL